MAALLVGLSIMAVMLTIAMPTWKQMAQREKEAELVFRGTQYARAIGLFQKKYANAFPPNLDVLVREKFLRRKYKDPITNDDFVPLTQTQANTPGSGAATAARPGQTPTATPPGQATPNAASPLGRTASGGMGTNVGGGTVGGIIGVTSKSKDKSIRIYNGRSHYNEWAFVFTPQMLAPGAAGVPGVAGQQGRPGQQRPGQQPGPAGGFGTGPGPTRRPGPGPVPPGRRNQNQD
jgi:type II secretory pathway pseudopilin PulG